MYDPDSTSSIYGYLDQFQNVSNANYDALQTSITKRTGNTKIGSTFFTFAYTWSHENGQCLRIPRAQLIGPPTTITTHFTRPVTQTSEIR